jgi:hypothetical protein
MYWSATSAWRRLDNPQTFIRVYRNVELASHMPSVKATNAGIMLIFSRSSRTMPLFLNPDHAEATCLIAQGAPFVKNLILHTNRKSFKSRSTSCNHNLMPILLLI